MSAITQVRKGMVVYRHGRAVGTVTSVRDGKIAVATLPVQQRPLNYYSEREFAEHGLSIGSQR